MGLPVSTLTARARKKTVWINWEHLMSRATSGGNGREKKGVEERASVAMF